MTKKPLHRKYVSRLELVANEEDHRAGVVLGVASFALGLLLPGTIPVPFSLATWMLLAIDRAVAWGVEESTEEGAFQLSAAARSIALAPVYLPLWFGGLNLGMFARSAAAWLWGS